MRSEERDLGEQYRKSRTTGQWEITPGGQETRGRDFSGGRGKDSVIVNDLFFSKFHFLTLLVYRIPF